MVTPYKKDEEAGNIDVICRATIYFTECILQCCYVNYTHVFGYIIAAVMTYLGRSSFSDMPSESIVPHDIWMEDDAVRQEDIAKHIVDEYMCLATDRVQVI